MTLAAALRLSAYLLAEVTRLQAKADRLRAELHRQRAELRRPTSRSHPMSDQQIPTIPCDHCKAPVIDATNTRNGGRLLVDAKPSPDGTYALLPAVLGGMLARSLTVAERFGLTVYKAHPVNCRRRPPTVALHQFDADPDVPVDPYSRSTWCRCGVAGALGDDRHPVDAPTLDELRYPSTPPAAAELDERRAGEVAR